jgi:hypothetical protein
VASVVVPVVVVGVPIAVELELGRTARGVVNVVASEGDLVILSVAETGILLAEVMFNDMNGETYTVQ